MKNTVELIGHYGSDLTHAGSAWQLTPSEILSDPKRLDRVRSLLVDTLAGKDNPDHGPLHTSPFEKSALHFRLITDIATHIHLLKHRIAVSVNSESARYKELKDKFYIPEDWPDDLKAMLYEDLREDYRKYHEYIHLLMQAGMSRSRAKESARFKLPYANQITQDVQFNFLSFMHFQRLRNDSHAQLEIREIAEQMLELVKATGEFPYSLEAFGW